MNCQTLKKNNNQSFPSGISKDSSKVKRQKNFGLKDSISIFYYKIISIENDTTIVDTSLTIKKDYKFNYLRRDEFGLIPFANAGQTYNALKLDRNSKLLPVFGARARHYNYMEVEDIDYYEVPTPFSELFFKTVFEQGQILDAFFTINTSRQFNMSVAYKGMRSLGNYQNSLTSTGNLRLTSNYHTKDERYHLKGHITFQDLLNNESGGLTDFDVEQFTSGSDEFLDRSVFDPAIQNADNILEGKRFYLNHSYALIREADSTSGTLILKNRVSFEDKYYQFNQSLRDDYFGPAFSRRIKDRVTLENFEANLAALWKSVIGEVSFGVTYNKLNYGYDFSTIIDNEYIINRIVTNTIALEGSYKKQFGDVNLWTKASTIVSGEFSGYQFEAEASYQFDEDNEIIANFSSASAASNFNTLLYQSNYINYNWYNKDRFSNEKTSQIGLDLNLNKIADFSLDYTVYNDYTYFAFSEENAGVKPFQEAQAISYLKFSAGRQFEIGKFSLDNKVMYQQVGGVEGVINVPDLILRNSLYYSDGLFKNDALFLQTGITFNYFTEFNANAYDPLLAEFYVQNNTKLGNFPRLDVFVNAKVRQTRIFLKAEHVNAAFTGYDYFAAPNYPYRDFNIRFGIVWNFFL
ncbi:putative porin [Subsaximicrobium wynnwilliamsii]|uniref:putative porin n=1 Tax=Subsaximicrobium wynnwilliamsii TaxID=291179 RepID=UPI0016789584|nr:putative porin [Subsaximicrobium wynnwilliamsii]